MTTKTLTTHKPRPVESDVPFTAKLPSGRTLFVLVPGPWCETDADGEVLFKPAAVRFLDRVQALAANLPPAPTPGHIRTLREALGLTQTQFAQRLGVDKMTVARWEWGKMKPSAEAVKGIEALRRVAGRKGVLLAS